MIRKSLLLVLGAITGVAVAACSTNEATGRSQFTGLMNTAQENQIGGSEQQKVEKQFGVYNDARLTSYVNGLCNRLQQGLERQDVTYKCTVLDSPVVNAFALPGGYININRGLIAYANSEAELASVIAHEMGHVTARHIAERYSTGTLTQLGGAVASAALGSQAASQLIGVGANLYLSSYSRSQETEADDLGIRYLSRAGYDPQAMAGFLGNLQRETALSAAEQGEEYKEMRNFMATHPLTSDRVARATQTAANYPVAQGDSGQDRLFAAINGMTFGDSAKDGFVRGSEFIHPALGFAFAVPPSFTVQNSAQQVVGKARSGSGAAFIFDAGNKPSSQAPTDYLQQWAGQTRLEGVQEMNVNGMRAATGQTQGSVNGRTATMRLVAIEWSPTQVFRFQFAMPSGTGAQEVEALKTVSYSLRRLSPSEKNVQAKRIQVVTALSSDTVQSMAARMAYDDLQDLRFRTLNGLNASDGVVPGRKYKIVVD